MKNIDTFSNIGAFSAAAPDSEREDLAKKYSALFGTDPAANTLKSFWIPIGKDDFLLDRNQRFVAVLAENGVHHDFKTTRGGHSWDVWRVYLPEFLQMVVPQQ